MNNPRQPRSRPPHLLRFAALVACVVLSVVFVNALNSGTNEGVGLSTASLLSVSGDAVPTATSVPTTAPLELPTVAPTATAVPATATPVPATATAVPPTAVPATATPVPAPPTAVPDAAPLAESAVEPADIEVATATPAPIVEPTATPIPVAQPTSEPVVIEPTPTTVVVVEATPIPTEPAPPPTAVQLSTSADLEQYVLAEINEVRANVGHSPLLLDPAISTISRDWSRTMASRGVFDGFIHRPSAELSALLPAGWREWGENIARAPDIILAQSSLEQSPGHYANMVGNFTHLGIGVFVEDGSVWVTQNFARY